jgi:hypothetical protein
VNEPCFVAAGVLSRASGRMVSVTDWASRLAADGCTGASGRKASRVATACGSPLRRTHGTRARGLTDCRTATAPRPMLTEVSTSLARGGLTETYADGGEYQPCHSRVNGDLCRWRCVPASPRAG